jgi:uncharacterized protein (TIGR03790 family)
MLRRIFIHLTFSSFLRIATSSLLQLFLFSGTGQALGPDELLLVANENVPEGINIARYYMKKRGVDAANLVRVRTSPAEQIGREAYDREIALPVREFIKRNDPERKIFRCIVLMYGIPLRILSSQPTAAEKYNLANLKARQSELESRKKEIAEGDEKRLKEINGQLVEIEGQIIRGSRDMEAASVDSELALVLENGYPLPGWLPNRYFAGFRGKELKDMPLNVLMVSRLDGPSPADVRRVIDDSLYAEEKGLSGIAYFDARWPEEAEGSKSAYRVYDRSLRNTARIMRKLAPLPVVLDERERLFQPGEAPNAALYCGWYSLANYVDAFTWARGAVGYHVASAECTTLKNKSSKVWCKLMLEKGVAATLGPVAEPYLQSFPAPEVFFGCLADGGPTLAECYALSNPFWSWRMVIIGDPLYRPFRIRKLLKKSKPAKRFSLLPEAP